MSSSIGSIGSSYSTTMQSMRTKMAESLFSKLDTSGQGYLTKTDLQAALDKVSSSSASSSTTSSVDDLFSKLDTNSDGKVTQEEFSDTLKKVAEQLDNQAMSMRMSGGMNGMGGMPPPPPPQDGDSGFTKDELTSQLSEIGSSDSKRSALISNIVNNFDKADTDGDGKVSFKEAMAFDQSTSSSSTSSSTSTDASSSTSSSDLNAKLLSQIMKLMQAYGLGNDETRNSLLSTLSVTA